MIFNAFFVLFEVAECFYPEAFLGLKEQESFSHAAVRPVTDFKPVKKKHFLNDSYAPLKWFSQAIFDLLVEMRSLK